MSMWYFQPLLPPETAPPSVAIIAQASAFHRFTHSRVWSRVNSILVAIGVALCTR